MNMFRSSNLRLMYRKLFLLPVILAMPFFLGAWSISMNRGINTNYVDRIEDGKTKKSEILTLFGDPQEIKRTPEGVTFVYKAFTTKESSRKSPKEAGMSSSASVDTPYSLEETLKKKTKGEGPVQEVSSTLTVFFGRDGDTVQSHEFKKIKE